MMGWKRREFITLLGGAAAAWPVAASAQQPSQLRRIGMLLPAAADNSETRPRVGAFLQGLQGFGWEIGGNARFDYRSATDPDRIRKHAAGNCRICAGRNTGTCQSDRTGFATGNTHPADCVCGGRRSRCGRDGRQPGAAGGNTTGFISAEFGMSAKWLELLKELMPGMSRVAVLQDPGNPGGIPQFAAIQTVAPTLGVELRSLGLREAGEMRAASRVRKRFQQRPNRN